MKTTTFSFTLLALFLLANMQPVIAQSASSTPSDDDLFGEIANMDKVLFTAFNSGDTSTLQKLFTKDLEFYHDQGGLSGYQANIDALGRLLTGENRIRRALVDGSLQVFPVPGFGAIEEGQHDFFETLPGQPERKTGTFKFIHIWKKTDDGWKVARVVSYDH